MLFLRKTAETIWNPPPRPPLSTNPLFLSNFFLNSIFVQISKTMYLPPPIANFRGQEETNEADACSVLVFSVHEFQHPPYQSAF